VIVDGRKSQWNVVKTVVLMLQVIFFLGGSGSGFYFIATNHDENGKGISCSGISAVT
jgi:hypothetical protein